MQLRFDDVGPRLCDGPVEGRRSEVVARWCAELLAERRITRTDSY